MPQPTGSIDPGVIPSAGQTAADKIALEYILVTHDESLIPSSKPEYTKATAYEVAWHLTQLARERSTSFRELALQYSDSTEYRWRTRPVTRNLSDPLMSDEAHRLHRSLRDLGR